MPPENETRPGRHGDGGDTHTKHEPRPCALSVSAAFG